MLLLINKLRISRFTSSLSLRLLLIICPRYLNSSTNCKADPFIVKHGKSELIIIFLRLGLNNKKHSYRSDTHSPVGPRHVWPKATEVKHDNVVCFTGRGLAEVYVWLNFSYLAIR